MTSLDFWEPVFREVTKPQKDMDPHLDKELFRDMNSIIAKKLNSYTGYKFVFTATHFK